MKEKKGLISLFLFFALVVILLYLSFTRLAVYAISKIYNIDIVYKSIRNESFKTFTFNDLKVVDKKRDVGLFSRYAKLTPRWRMGRALDNVEVDFSLRDVQFLKNQLNRSQDYDTLSGLVAIPFRGGWTYREISGDIQMSKRGFQIRDLIATSDEIRISLAGWVNNDNTLESEIVIYFSKSLAANIPEELSGVVLRDEADEWKSLSVRLKGDYAAPSIQVSGKLFRLNIKPSPDAAKTDGEIAF